MANILQRLQRVDQRLAKIDRRLGFLDGRAYFRPYGETNYVPVDLFTFEDNGVSEKKLETGEAVSGHRFTLHVNRAWLAANQGEGEWAISRTGSPQIPCVKESETSQDNQTFGVVVLRVVQEINHVGF